MNVFPTGGGVLYPNRNARMVGPLFSPGTRSVEIPLYVSSAHLIPRAARQGLEETCTSEQDS